MSSPGIPIPPDVACLINEAWDRGREDARRGVSESPYPWGSPENVFWEFGQKDAADDKERGMVVV